MALPGFDYKEQYIGTGDTTAYPFSFYVTDPSHIRIYVQDGNGNIVTDTKGDDPLVVSSVVFDNDEDDGNLLNLAAFLPSNYVLTMFTANDWPDQPTDWPDKFSFTLSDIEGTFDYVVSLIQRVAFLAQRALRLHDLDDIDGFDMRLPLDLQDHPSEIITINSGANGFAVAGTVASIISEAAAEALLETEAYIQSVFALTLLRAGTWTVPANTNLDLPNQSTDANVNTQVDYVARIRRGSTTYARLEFSIFYRNFAWEIAVAGDRYADASSDPGITPTVNPLSGQINMAVANDGGADAKIDLYKILWPS